MTMAISMSLAVIALIGFSSLRAQTQFGDAVERLRESVTQRRTETNTAVQVQANAGEDSSQIAFGRIMTFTPGSGTVLVQTLTTSSNQAPPGNQTVTTTADNQISYNMAWGIKYQRGQDAPAGAITPRVRQVAFIRSPRDGALYTAVSPADGWPLTAGHYIYDQFISGAIPTGVRLQVSDGTRTATIDIDPATNGVGRTFK